MDVPDENLDIFDQPDALDLSGNDGDTYHQPALSRSSRLSKHVTPWLNCSYILEKLPDDPRSFPTKVSLRPSRLI